MQKQSHIVLLQTLGIRYYQSYFFFTAVYDLPSFRNSVKQTY